MEKAECLFECCNCGECFDENHPFYDMCEGKNTDKQKLKRTKSVEQNLKKVKSLSELNE